MTNGVTHSLTHWSRVGLVLGCLHYVGVGVSVLADADAVSHAAQDAFWRRIVVALGVVLFVVASYHQFVCNLLLARLKRQNRMQHVVPHGDWFDVVRSPLFSCEVLIYVALALVAGGTNGSLYFILVWVLANQAAAAQLSSDWYDRKFRAEQRRGFPRWKLVPRVW